jgi:hypothetical protein
MILPFFFAAKCAILETQQRISFRFVLVPLLRQPTATLWSLDISTPYEPDQMRHTCEDSVK